MMIFWIVCVLFVATALLFVVLPLWRASSKNNAVERDGANLEIFRDQIAEMDDLSNGLLTQEMYDQGKRELQSRLLDEVGDAKAEGKVLIRNPLKMLAMALSVLLPVIAITVYMQVGNRQALQQQPVTQDDGFGDISSAAELKALEEQVAAQADNVQGLLRLARSYSQMQRFDDAAVAYDKLTKLVPDEAQLWADYADVLAMAAGKSLLGTPTTMLDKALALEPDNFKALALSGSAAMERRDLRLPYVIGKSC
jgi:cytochrome c-type biogenesis protein CcmH